MAAAFLALAAGAHAVETAKQPWEQYSKRVEASQSVTQLGSDLFGDKVNTQDGGLSFSATDVSLPGNSVLPVSFTRSYTVRPGQDYRSDLMLGDWDIEVPNVSGVFAPNWLSGNQAAPGNRCSTQHRPKLPTVPVGAYVPHRDFWHGNHIQIPGVGGGEILLSNTGSHWGITNDQIRISCLSSIKNGTGEGFLAEAPDGTRYWFDWMAQYYEPGIEFRVEQTQLVPLRKNVLYATRVEDRFGNRVNYTYTNQWAQPGKLTTIEASDGRRIDIGYLDGRISTIVAAGRSWNYLYGTAGGKATLTQVTQPDGSRWGIGFSEFGTAKIEYPTGSIAEPARSCIMHATPKVYIQPSGTITHPSGAVGFFQVQIQRHGKSNVPLSCDNVTTTGPGSPGHDNDPNDDINQFVIDYDKFSIKTKQITGPGLPPYQWGYSYSADISFVLRSGTSIRYPVCVLSYEQCHQPTCTSDSCAGTSRLTVTGPAGEWIRYTHGNSFRYNEGKLLKVETGTSASNVLRTHLSAYDLTLIDQAYPANYGISLRTDSEAFTSEYHRPLRETKINQQGVTFTRVVELFDGFARPLIETKSSTVVGNPIKTDATEYYDDLSLWVLGQVKRMTTNGVETSRTEFSWKALPEKAYRFGKLQQTLTYETALSAQVGTIKTVTDGNNNVTTLGNWFRGVPRLIKYPATPEAPSGATQTSVVDLDGWITAVFDELGYKTCYQHDLMGRTKLVSYPSDEKILPQICDTDQRTWKQTASTFVQVQVAEYEIPAGHWRQTVTTGNATRISYFDAFWRPILTREFDAANVAGTQRFQRFTYDHEGRNTFSAYPGTTDALTTGVWREYDALGRLTSSAQSSELVSTSNPSGLLVTLSEYLPGFRTRVTNPRGHQTLTTLYQAYDEPTYDLPRGINHPEGAYTEIYRDVFGKPTAIKRRNLDGSVAATRHYVYDGHQQLCKTIEPETRATVMDYDGAGNLQWSASGLEMMAGTCDTIAARDSGRTVTRTYDARNRVRQLQFPDGRGDQLWSYTADGLPATITTWNQQGGGAPVVNAYTYNKRRMLIGESVQQPNWYSWGVGYGFDANGSLSTQSFPDGASAVSFHPNALGQSTGVTDHAGNIYASGVQYHPNGAIKQFHYGNGLQHLMQQNARQLPYRSTDSGVFDFTFGYDANGNTTAIREVNAQPYVYSGNRDLAYDGLDRLVSAHLHWRMINSYAYDAIDNIVGKSHFNGSTTVDHQYVYDSRNQLGNVRDTDLSASIVGYGYDPQGNVQNRNGQIYDFDFGNRLRKVTDKETYRYDGMGRRVMATSAGTSIFSMYTQAGHIPFQEDYRRGVRLYNIYLGGSLLAVREANHATGAVVSRYQHTDALGSPVAVTDEAGTVVSRTDWDPYGANLSAPSYNGIGYTGHLQDSATGLTYMQQRYYDPAIGRFLSVDPIAANSNTGAGFNRYAYAVNNPYRFTDPDGRCEAPTGTRICSRDMVQRAGPIDRWPESSSKRTDMRSWPVPGHTKINAADKPREGKGEFGTARNTSRGASTHTGVDIEAPTGASVVAAADGVVVNVQPNPSSTYGVQVVIKHGDGTFTQYAHLNKASAVPGSPVNSGEQIGTVGRSGNTPALGDSHLHHERRIGSPAPRPAGGTVVDPLPYLPVP